MSLQYIKRYHVGFSWNVSIRIWSLLLTVLMAFMTHLIGTVLLLVFFKESLISMTAVLLIKTLNPEMRTSGRVPILADFGFALRFLRDDGSVRTIDINHGTPQFVAPEIFRPGPIRNICKCDCWSTGVTFFVLMAGKVLFDGDTPAAIYRNMVNGHYGYPNHLKNITSRDKNYFGYMEMVKGLCRVEPDSRLSALQALMHEVFLVNKYDDCVNL